MTIHYRPDIEAVAPTHGLDPDLVEAVVWQESSGDAHARRPEPKFYQRYLEPRPEWDGYHWLRIGSSLGLMQIMPSTAIETGLVHRTDPDFPESLFRPLTNLNVGCALLARLVIWAGGDVRKALAAYNGGRGNWAGTAPQQYADEVLAKLAQIRQR